MQTLAKYVFETGVLLEVGDHIPDILSKNSFIKHLLIAEDFELKQSNTKHGKVKFLQVNF
jgi:hypothetical protein